MVRGRERGAVAALWAMHGGGRHSGPHGVRQGLVPSVVRMDPVGELLDGHDLEATDQVEALVAGRDAFLDHGLHGVPQVGEGRAEHVRRRFGVGSHDR